MPNKISEAKEYQKILPTEHWMYHDDPWTLHRHSVKLVTSGEHPGIHVHTKTKYGRRHAVFYKGKKTILLQNKDINSFGDKRKAGSKAYRSADKVGMAYDKLYHGQAKISESSNKFMSILESKLQETKSLVGQHLDKKSIGTKTK